MKVAWIATLITASTIGHILAQSASTRVPASPKCVELNEGVMGQMARGDFKEAELIVSSVLLSDADPARGSCAGLILSNMASFMYISGQIADSERFAEKSVQILEKVHSPNDESLLRPLQTLVVAELGQGKTTRAREGFKRMQSIRIQKAEDRALLNGTAAVLSELEGRRTEAEAEFLATIDAWEKAGHGESADVGGVLINLGSLYLNEGRFDDAQRTLDRSATILNRATDAVPIDRIELLLCRGVLCARQSDWGQAEKDFRDALLMADRESWVDPVALRSLLTIYAVALRKNGHRREARSIEARAVKVQIDRTTASIVDIADLLPKVKPSKK